MFLILELSDVKPSLTSPMLDMVSLIDPLFNPIVQYSIIQLRIIIRINVLDKQISSLPHGIIQIVDVQDVDVEVRVGQIVGGVANDIKVCQNLIILVFSRRWNVLWRLGLNTPWRPSGDVTLIRNTVGETILFRYLRNGNVDGKVRVADDRNLGEI